jgi:hypothetical protein
MGSKDQEDHGSKPAQAKKYFRPPSQPSAGHSGTYLLFQNIQEAEIRRTAVLGQLRQKLFVRTYFIREKKKWAWWCMPVIPATEDSLK